MSSSQKQPLFQPDQLPDISTPTSAYAAARQVQLIERLRRRLETSALWAEVRVWFLSQPERWRLWLIALRRWSTVPRLATLALSAGLTVGVIGQPGVALAQGPVGAEFRVNSYTTSNQLLPHVAMDQDGDFVIAWVTSYQDGDATGIYAQRFNASRLRQGNEFPVNTYTTSFQAFPDVAIDQNGEFVITWHSQTQDTGDFDYGVYAQRYRANGTPEGNEFQVNTWTTDNQERPRIAMDADGDFVIVWTSDNQDGSSAGVYGQRYDAAGNKQGNEFRVNTYTTGFQRTPDAAMDAVGNFVVVWVSETQDGSQSGIYAQRYQADSTPLGGEFRVNVYTTDNQDGPSVAMNNDGEFVIVWDSVQDGDSAGVYARQYNADGTPKDGEFQINTYTTNAQGLSSVAIDGDGDFVVVWTSEDQDGSGNGIYARSYDKLGTVQRDEFQVNTYTANAQDFSTVAMDENGNFIIAWASSDQDGSLAGIYAQRYGLPQLTLAKTVNTPLPQQNQRLTYTLTVDNSGILTATNAVISDTLPVGLTFAGPVTLEGSSGTIGPPPLIASGLTIAPNGRITVTLPVTVTAETGEITNVAAVTSAEVTTPVTGSVTITIGGQVVYLPVVLKS